MHGLCCSERLGGKALVTPLCWGERYPAGEDPRGQSGRRTVAGEQSCPSPPICKVRRRVQVHGRRTGRLAPHAEADRGLCGSQDLTSADPDPRTKTRRCSHSPDGDQNLPESAADRVGGQSYICLVNHSADESDLPRDWGNNRLSDVRTKLHGAVPRTKYASGFNKWIRDRSRNRRHEAGHQNTEDNRQHLSLCARQ